MFPRSPARLCPAFLLLGSLAPPAAAQVDEAVVGRIEEVTGAATFEVPIQVPPGAAGHAPRISLVYDHTTARGGAGWIGLGWQIAGLGAIERDRSFGPPFDHAAAPCGAGPCYRDAFVLDGARLVADGAQGRHRTQVDDGLRITFLGDALGWLVVDRRGRRLQYGDRPDARVEGSGGQTFAWLLSRAEDTHGNWIEYRYAAGVGVRYPSEIVYAQSGAPANRSVRFLLNDPLADPRPDRTIRYDGGFRQQVDRRLVAIEVRGAQDALVARYELAYAQSPDSGRSLLASVLRVGADGATSWARPFVFAHAAGSRSFEEASTSFSPPIYTGTGSGMWVPYFDDFDDHCCTRQTRLAHDLNADGLLDVLERDGANGWRWYRSSGDRLEDAEPFDPGNSAYLSFSHAYPSLCSLTDQLVVDFDADGYLDQLSTVAGSWLVRRGVRGGFEVPASEASYTVAVPSASTLSCAAGHEQHPAVGLQDGSGSAAGAPHETTTALLDLTGDGRPDRVWTRADQPWKVWVNAGDPPPAPADLLEPPILWPDPAGRALAHGLDPAYQVFDLNGDALPDRVFRDATTGRWRVAYNWGAGFDAPEDLAGPDAPPRLVQWHDGTENPALADIDADGLVDRIEMLWDWELGAGRWHVWFGTGDGFRESAVVWQGLAAADDWGWVRSPGFLGTHEDLVDWNGDGLPDKQRHTGQVHLQPGGYVDLLELATNPLGGSTRFGYGSSARQRDDAGEPANPDLAGTRVVAERIALWSGRDDAAEIADELEYRGGVFDPVARQFRGFAEVRRFRLESSDPNDPWSETTSRRRTDPACSGELESRQVRIAGVVLERESITHQVVAGAGWAACVRESRTEESVEGNETGKKVRRTIWRYDAGGYEPTEIEDWTVLDAEQGVTSPRLERLTRIEYAEPLDDALSPTSAVASLSVHDGADPNRVLSHRRFRYDGRSDGRVDRGSITQVEAWLAHPAEDPVQEPPRWVTEMVGEYDGHGNATRVNGAPGEDDPDGLATAVAYDDVYATFPVAVALGADEAAPLVTAISYQGCAAGLEPPPALGLACTVTAPGGLVEAYGYDALGRTVRREHASGLVVIRSHAFAPPGEPAEVRVEERLLLQTPEPAELRSAAWLDGLGRVFRMEWPGTREQTIRVVRGFDARGRTASETLPHFVDPGDAGTPAGTPTRAISYDALGRVALVREHDGATHRRWSYAPWSVTEEVFFAAPAPGVPWQTRTRSRFDASGNRIAVGDYESGNFALWTTARYDALGHLLELADPLANDTARCLQWKGAYGWQSQGAGAICAPGGAYPETRVAWDTLGRRVRLDDPDSGVATWQYDDAGRLRVRAEGAPGQEVARLEYRHDAFGRVREQRVWPAGAGAAHASFVYGTDPGSSDHGRLIGVDALDGSQPPARYAYAYDGAGRLERVRQTSEGREFENAWAYDELGRVRVRVFPDGTDFVHHWDGARLARIFSHDSASTGAYYGWVLNRAEYDALGRPTKLELGDRAEASGTEDPIAGIDWSYDEATARLDRITARRQPGMPPVYEVSHEWDGLGRLLARSGIHRLLEEPIAESFAYDALGRLITAVGRWEQPLGNPEPVAWHYGYDPLGNLRAQTSDNPDPATARERFWTHGDFRAPRRLTRFSEQRGGVESEETIAWDAAGRVVERAAQAPGRSAHFAWSALGRAWQTGVDHSLEHDAFRNRVVERVGPSTIVHVGPDFEVDLLLGQAQKSIRVAGMRVATLASFYAPEPARGPWSLPRLPRPLAAAGDALPLVLLALGLVGIAALAVGRRSAWLALPGAGLLAAALIWLPHPARPGGGWIGGPLPHGRHAERILFHLPDHLGSTRAVVDEWNAVVEAREYEPFGETVRHVGALDLQHRFTGKPWNQTAGVQDYGARLYDPAWGRFLAPDAIVESADARGSNAYAYALNRPTSLIDPTGNFTGLPVGGVVVFSFHEFVNVSTQIPGVEPMCCVSGRQTTWDRDGDGTDDARETGDVFPASLRTEVALILSLQRQHGDPFWVKLLEWLARDAAAQIIGLYGNVVGLLHGLQQTAKGLVQGDLRRVRDGLGSIAWALVPRHGWYGGPLWGLGGTRQSPITAMDGDFVTHDEGWREASLPENAANAGAIRSRADLQLVRDVWSLDQPQPGPFGQVYRLGVTIIFPTLAVTRNAI